MIPPLKISVEEVPGAVVVHAEGDVDIETGPRFYAGLIQSAHERPHHQHVIVDLTGVTFFGARGVDVLGKSYDLFRQSKQALVVVAPPGTIVRRVLDIFPQLMAVMDNVPAAITFAQKREGLIVQDQ